MTHLKTNLVEYFFLVYEFSENLVKTKIIIFNFYRLFIQYLHEASLSLFLQCFGFEPNKNFNILIFRWVSNLFLSSWLTFEHFCILLVKAWWKIYLNIKWTRISIFQCKFTIAFIKILFMGRTIFLARIGHILPFIIFGIRSVYFFVSLVFFVMRIEKMRKITVFEQAIGFGIESFDACRYAIEKRNIA